MTFLLGALALLLAGGLAALLLGRGIWAARVGQSANVCSALLGLYAALSTLLHDSSEILTFSTGLTLGESALRLDALSAFFMLPVFLLDGLLALYSFNQLKIYHAQGRHLGAHCFALSLMVGGSTLVLAAADAFLFLIAWELMSLAPFFLILLHSSESKSSSAAWVYLVAAHLGALVLMLLFALMTREAGSFSFLAYENFGAFKDAGLFFVLALLGFGVKSGFIPLHVWLPETYAASPSNVTAFLSGALINMGLYGILRTLTFLGAGAFWWPYVFLCAGAFTALAGILLALMQPDLKRSLAYSSIENMGIACLGLGTTLLAAQHNQQLLATLAGSGTLLHIFNHSLFKSLLFLSAGSVQLHTGTTDLDRLGGLQKRLPLTGAAFAVGAAAICALPPLNGFAGEFLLYCGFFTGGNLFKGGENALALWICVFILATVGTLALLCFVRAYGLVFLGQGRTADYVPQENKRVCAPFLILAGLCLLAGLCMPWVCRLFLPVLRLLPGGPPADASLASQEAALAPALNLLRYVSIGFIVFMGFLLLCLLLRRALFRRKPQGISPTWDCGYARPTPRMQYVSASFSQPIAKMMHLFLRPRLTRTDLQGYFPAQAKAKLVTPDLAMEGWERLIFRVVGKIAERSKALQHGLLNVYILYIFLALILTLAWKLR